MLVADYVKLFQKKKKLMDYNLIQLATLSKAITPHFFRFDGQTSIRIAHHSRFSFSKCFSISMWMRIDTNSKPEGQRLIDKNAAGAIEGYNLDLFEEEDSSLISKQFFLRFCGGYTCFLDKRPLIPGTWYHIAITYDTRTNPEYRYIKFFVNGIMTSNLNPYTDISRVSYDLVIGGPSEGGAPLFKGDLDEISIWDIPLSINKIRKLMYGRLNGTENGLVLYLPLDKHTEEKMVVDQSQYQQHGRVQGICQWIPSEGKPLILEKSY